MTATTMPMATRRARSHPGRLLLRYSMWDSWGLGDDQKSRGAKGRKGFAVGTIFRASDEANLACADAQSAHRAVPAHTGCGYIGHPAFPAPSAVRAAKAKGITRAQSHGEKANA